MSSNTNVNVLPKRKGAVSVRHMVQIGMLSGVAVILMLFEIPLWFAPGFYKIDISEVPVLIGAFTMGPAAGVIIELIKVLLNLIINGTVTAGTGELANFLIGCSFIVPAALIYKNRKNRKHALIGMAAGTLSMTILGCIVNAYILLPAYSAAFNMPLDTLVGMGTAINPSINGITSFVMLVVGPFNLLKGVIASVITILIYKKISVVLKENH